MTKKPEISIIMSVDINIKDGSKIDYKRPIIGDKSNPPKSVRFLKLKATIEAFKAAWAAVGIYDRALREAPSIFSTVSKQDMMAAYLSMCGGSRQKAKKAVKKQIDKYLEHLEGEKCQH